MRYYYRSRRLNFKRNINFILIVIILVFLLFNKGMRSLISSYYKYKFQMKELERCMEENRKLKQKLALIENNLQMVEKLARKEGMCYPREKIYRIIKIKSQ
jgi:cell division protein FtsB